MRKGGGFGCGESDKKCGGLLFFSHFVHVFAFLCTFVHFFAEKINDFSCQISTIQKKRKKWLWFQEMDDWGLIHSQGVGWA